MEVGVSLSYSEFLVGLAIGVGEPLLMVSL